MKRIYRKTAMTVAAIIAFCLTSGIPANAYEPRIHCQEDTLKVSRILGALDGKDKEFGTRIVAAAKELEGTSWAESPDNDSIGTIVIDLHGFDRLDFANIVLALAKTSLEKVPRVSEFERHLESVSRRKGEDNGFSSKLFYGADWVVDNVYRGNIKEMTEYLGGGGVKTKTLDYLTRHRDEYPALKNADVYDKVRMMEMGYRSHRIPHIKKQTSSNKGLHELMKDGDIIMMLSPEMDYDVYDVCFVEMREGEPYLIHISHENGKVVSDPYPMSRLFKLEGQFFYGFRWLRPQE